MTGMGTLIRNYTSLDLGEVDVNEEGAVKGVSTSILGELRATTYTISARGSRGCADVAALACGKRSVVTCGISKSMLF